MGLLRVVEIINISAGGLSLLMTVSCRPVSTTGTTPPSPLTPAGTALSTMEVSINHVYLTLA